MRTLDADEVPDLLRPSGQLFRRPRRTWHPTDLCCGHLRRDVLSLLDSGFPLLMNEQKRGSLHSAQDTADVDVVPDVTETGSDVGSARASRLHRI